MELESIIVRQIKDNEKACELNETLKKYLQEAQVDLFSTGNEAFERAKA